MIRVKICGITSAADALEALECGADAIGIVFVRKSPRYVAEAAARVIVSALPPWASVVGVFADEPVHNVIRVARKLSLSAVQLHGDELPAQLELLKPLRCIKTVRVV
ncbi:MAG: phosphoribosylanthranilate isomerase, partial [Candidatus Omnitrophota bacterium]